MEPPVPIKIRPSAVPAARVPSGDMVMAVMKGGGEVKPGAIAGEGPVIRKLIEMSDAGAE